MRTGIQSFAGLRVSFAQLEYSIVGEVGTVDVCINVSTEGLVFDRPVVYSLVIIPGTADGETVVSLA